MIADCRRMLRYALDEGTPIPATLAQSISQIDRFLVAAHRRPLSEVPEDVLTSGGKSQISSAPPTESSRSVNEVILDAHNALSNLVAPATAQSLRATDPAIVLFGLPPIAKFAIIGSVVCTLGFLAAVSKPIASALADTAATQTAASPKPNRSADATGPSSPRPTPTAAP